jgi:hypothetical protein
MIINQSFLTPFVSAPWILVAGGALGGPGGISQTLSQKGHLMHGLCMLMLDGTFGQAQMPVCSRTLHFFVIKCVHVYPDGRLVFGSKMGPCCRMFNLNASVLTRPLAPTRPQAAWAVC